MNSPVFRIENVSHQYSDKRRGSTLQALTSASLDVVEGELLCLIGPSGCGKSTLLNMMGGLLAPSSGTISVEGAPLRGPLPKKLAFVFQENALFPWNTIFENVDLAMMFQGVAKSERLGRAKQAIADVGLSEFSNHYPRQLSGGMRQRAALARALALETPIILMDEPFGALDEQTRMILGEDLSILLARRKKTIVFVTHSLGEAVFLADRVAVFSARPGRIKEIVAIDEPHPRNSSFVTSARFAEWRNHLYELLHVEIRKTVQGVSAPFEKVRT